MKQPPSSNCFYYSSIFQRFETCVCVESKIIDCICTPNVLWQRCFPTCTKRYKLGFLFNEADEMKSNRAHKDQRRGEESQRTFHLNIWMQCMITEPRKNYLSGLRMLFKSQLIHAKQRQVFPFTSPGLLFLWKLPRPTLPAASLFMGVMPTLQEGGGEGVNCQNNDV